MMAGVTGAWRLGRAALEMGLSRVHNVWGRIQAGCWPAFQFQRGAAYSVIQPTKAPHERATSSIMAEPRCGVFGTPPKLKVGGSSLLVGQGTQTVAPRPPHKQ